MEGSYDEYEFPLGSHVVTPRRGYLHHGVYVDNGKVVHCAGLGRGWRRGPVEEVSLARFARGRSVWIRRRAYAARDELAYDAGQIVLRARPVSVETRSPWRATVMQKAGRNVLAYSRQYRRNPEWSES